MSQARTVVVDNEAVHALADVEHHKHRRVLAVIEAVASRNLRRAGSVRLVMPTAVRVEACWDRRAPRTAAVNRLRIHDAPLDTVSADRAARVCDSLAISVADAHIASTLEASAGPHAVLTSDSDDVQRIADHLGVRLNIVPV
jgi:D-arabinose 5-phosphate isomerase GutQ